MGKQTVLVTGAAGVVGRALIAELADDYQLICLCHRTATRDGRVREVYGDVTAPGLEIPPASYRRLAAEVDVVLHCAASTGWNADPETLFHTNVRGTERVIEFTAQAQAVLFHMSTAFVSSGPEQVQRANGAASYITSKAAAEELLKRDGVPAVIVRPSVFIGDSADGRIAAFQGLHNVAGSMLRDALPVVPADAATLIDYIPQDIAARAVRVLLERRATAGEYWLTAGNEAVTLDEMVRVALEVARVLGIETHPPRLMPASTVRRLLLPLLDDVMTPALRRHFQAQLDLLHLFQGREPLPSSLPDLGIHLSRQSQLAAFRRSTEYWALKHGLGRDAGGTANPRPAVSRWLLGQRRSGTGDAPDRGPRPSRVPS